MTDSVPFSDGTIPTDSDFLTPEELKAIAEWNAAPVPPSKAGVGFYGSNHSVSLLISNLAKAKGEFDDIFKDAIGQFGMQKIKYTELSTYISATTPALSRYGIAVLALISRTDPTNSGSVVTIIAGHGARIETSCLIPGVEGLKDSLGGKDAALPTKHWGALVTYVRRYCLSAALNLFGDADDPDKVPLPKEPRGENGKSGATFVPTAAQAKVVNAALNGAPADEGISVPTFDRKPIEGREGPITPEEHAACLKQFKLGNYPGNEVQMILKHLRVPQDGRTGQDADNILEFLAWLEPEDNYNAFIESIS